MNSSKFFLSTLIAAAAMTSSAYAETVGVIDTTNEKLKAYWNFDTSSTPNKGDGWLECPTWNELGYGECGGNTATNPYNNNAGIVVSDGFTVSFDVKDITKGGHLLTMATQQMHQGWRVLSLTVDTSGNLSSYINGQPATKVTGSISSLEDWTTVTLVGQKNENVLNLKLYVNGVAGNTEGVNIGAGNFVTETVKSFQFGYYGTATNSAAMDLDNILVYNKALTDTEIAGLQLLTWNGAAGASWNVEGVWKNGGQTVSFVAGNNVHLVKGSSVKVESGDSITAGRITMDSGAALDVGGTLTATGLDAKAGESTISGTGSITVGNVSVADGATLNVSAGLSGSGALTKTGAGKLVLSGTTTYSGGLTVVSGELVVKNRMSGGNVVIESEATVDVSDPNGSLFSVDTHVSGKTLTVRGTLKLLSGDWSATGSLGKLQHNRNTFIVDGGTVEYMKAQENVLRSQTITANGGTIVANIGTAESSANLTFKGNASGNAFETAGGTLTFDIGEYARVSLEGTTGIISGTAEVSKKGAGILTFSGANLYSGGTTITKGVLVANNTAALGSGDVSIMSGAQLDLDSALTVSGNMTLTAFGTDIVGEDGANGFITTDAGATLTLGADKHVYVNIFWLKNSVEMTDEGIALQLATGGALSSLTADNFLIGTEVEEYGLSWTEETAWDISSWDGATGVLTLVAAVPEPSAFGLLAGIGALALVAARRRRK